MFSTQLKSDLLHFKTTETTLMTLNELKKMKRRERKMLQNYINIYNNIYPEFYARNVSDPFKFVLLINCTETLSSSLQIVFDRCSQMMCLSAVQHYNIAF